MDARERGQGAMGASARSVSIWAGPFRLHFFLHYSMYRTFGWVVMHGMVLCPQKLTKEHKMNDHTVDLCWNVI